MSAIVADRRVMRWSIRIQQWLRLCLRLSRMAVPGLIPGRLRVTAQCVFLQPNPKPLTPGT